MGRSKTAHIKFLEKTPLADIDTEEIKSADLIQYVRNRRKAGAGPSTANNDIFWLRIILRYARAVWETPFDLAILDNAYEALKPEKFVGKSRTRSHRPTQAELEVLTEYFRKKERHQSTIPMSDILWFAIHSARRQSEITRLLIEDNDESTQTGIVRNLKHSTQRELLCRFKYTPGAWEILSRPDRDDDRIFPFDSKPVSAAFTCACRVLEIDDLPFHDLRHEATSRLFETGYSIVEVQQ